MDHAKGHRQRLLERYHKNGLSGLHDYEVVELLLSLLIPRKDTKPLAKELLAKYGSITALLAAPERELQEFNGLGEVIVTKLKFLRSMASFCLQEQFLEKEFIRSQQDVEHYLRFHFSHLRNEYAVALFLDNQNRVMRAEIIAEGTVDHCTVYPRRIFDAAFQCEAASVLLAHNHPGGSTEVSSADWAITERIHNAGRLLDIALVDHVIITDSGLVSLRAKPRWKKLET